MADLIVNGEEANTCCCNLWSGMTDHAWPEGYRLADVKRITAYLRWLEALQYAPEIRSAKAAFEAFCFPRCDSYHFEELFHIWRYVVPPPIGVEAFLIKNPIAPPVVERISFPSEARAEFVRELVERYGYEHFEDGVICQFAYKGDKGPWEYFAKRICKKLARQGHGNCHQVLRNSVKRRYLRDMFIDVIYALKWICPRSELLEMIRSPTLTFDKCHWPSRARPLDFGGSLISWFEDILIQFGLAEIATYRDKLRFRRTVTKSFGKKLLTKAIWSDDLCRFSARLVRENHSAAVSCLLNRYTNFFRRPQKDREEWSWHLRKDEVHWPYVLVSVVGRTLFMSIWRRCSSIEDISLRRLYDDHSFDIKAQIRRVNRGAIKLRARELHARAIELNKLFRYSRPVTDSSSGE